LKWWVAVAAALAEELVVGALVGMVVILLLEVTLQTAELVDLYRILPVVPVEVIPLVQEQGMGLAGVPQGMEV
jgi:hypothetical protein